MNKKQKKLLNKMILLKSGTEYSISGGGRIMLMFVSLAGGWKEYLKEEVCKADAEMARTFLEQEKKYGIKVILPQRVNGLDANYEYQYKRVRVKK